MIELMGISVEEFAHPEETAALNALRKAKSLERLLNWIAKESTQLILKTEILGNYFGITPKDMPQLYGLVREVCKTLDYEPVPRLYLSRNEKLKIQIFAGESPLLLFPDFIIHDFSEEMLRFQIGCAVTALKAQTSQLKMAAAAAMLISGEIPVIGEVILPVLANWSRKAELTEDRGGLLACQDIHAAIRTLMRTAGLPTQYIDTSCLPEYMKACQPAGKLSAASRYLQTAFRMEAWNNDRIIKLYQWYHLGQYDDILEEYE